MNDTTQEILKRVKPSEDVFGHAIYDYFQNCNIEGAGNLGCRTFFSEYPDWPVRERKAMSNIFTRKLNHIRE